MLAALIPECCDLNTLTVKIVILTNEKLSQAEFVFIINRHKPVHFYAILIIITFHMITLKHCEIAVH